MAIFRKYRRYRGPADEDIATLHFTIILDEELEQTAWGILTDSRAELENKIRNTVTDTLGPEYPVSRIFFARGSIEILIGISAGLYATYVGVSRYKNFSESLTLLVRQLREIFQRFFDRNKQQHLVVTGTWIPSPTLQQQNLTTLKPTVGSDLKPVLWYLVLSHAALLAVVIWQALH